MVVPYKVDKLKGSRFHLGNIDNVPKSSWINFYIHERVGLKS